MRHGHLVALFIALAAIFASAGNAAAAGTELPTRATPGLSVQKAQANCSRWTDECVSCSRGADGAPPLCSNIGPACQPQAIRCLSLDAPQSDPSKK